MFIGVYVLMMYVLMKYAQGDVWRCFAMLAFHNLFSKQKLPATLMLRGTASRAGTNSFQISCASHEGSLLFNVGYVPLVLGGRRTQSEAAFPHRHALKSLSVLTKRLGYECLLFQGLNLNTHELQKRNSLL